uniref:Uncharacterized protein n=1 Tax=Strigamia maritima TaxID=126957 RepID=T1ITM2_STRMM
ASQDWRHRIGVTGLASQDWRHRIGVTGLASQDWAVFFPIRLTAFPIRLTAFPIRLTAFPIRLTAFPIRLTAFPIRLTAFPIRLTAFPIRLTAFPIRLTAFPIRLTAFPIRLTDKPACEAFRSLFVLGPDCHVYFDTRTKTPYWTVEKISKDNVEADLHRHCEEFKFNCNLPVGFRFGNLGNNNRFDIKSVEIPLQTRDATIGLDGNPIYIKQEQCEFCQARDYWNIFQKYLTFLCKLYDKTEVCSGVVYTPKQAAANTCHGFTLAEVNRAYYFKAISCKNPDGSFRFECYKFNLLGEGCGARCLMDYHVSREELERDVGFTIFEKITQNMVKESDTRIHPDFNAH